MGFSFAKTNYKTKLHILSSMTHKTKVKPDTTVQLILALYEQSKPIELRKLR